MKTSIYIDGYNLYYGRLRNTQFKWLDVVALFSNMAITIEPKSAVNAVKYFTAPALTKFARHGAESMKAQNDYHRALEAKYPGVFSKILGSHVFEKDGTSLPIYVEGQAFNKRHIVSTTQEKIDWYFNEFKTQPDKKFGSGAGKVILCDFLLNTIQNEDAYFSFDILNAEKSPTRWDEFLDDCVAFACLHSYLNKTALPIDDTQLSTMLNFLGATGKVNSIASAIH